MRFGRKECGRHSGSSPMMLLHRPRGTGSVGREELARRADDFAHGRFSLLLRGGKSRSRIATVHPRCSRHLRAPRQGSTESCGAAPGFPRTTRVVGGSLVPKTQATLDELQGRGPNSKCDRYLPPSSHSSPNIHWSWISASSQNVCERIVAVRQRNVRPTRGVLVGRRSRGATHD